MGFLDERMRMELQRRLADMVNPVRLVFFTQELECATCRETGQLLRELAEVSDKIRLDVYNFQLDREQVATFGVDKIPATVVLGERDYGIRFYGIPSGYEFAALIDTIVAVSRADSGLSPETREKLRRVSAPLHIQVLVTPT
ncbi:MAG: thioredoxin family protein [Blastocatellia bacterium]|nr:thioredoxin family protein [Blastocatellia bacterium]MCS7158429.1 thioredoxin family protein [Blastocatellia bacterium]MCX7752935.1 thioredoxin family protein [Blastocatellia bacterium]MDW8167991.1 thioredoxin family protein [Acidobacteriota bacterium]MDW8256366.1 thioredoxin family protein [Acidobacteriota bacterium]